MEVKELDIKNFKGSEKISIQTANSTYEFSVTDPETRTGVLTGGALGDSTAIAVLLGAAHGDKNSESLRLSIGTRAIFLCSSDTGSRRLVTSPVRVLLYTGGGQSATRPAIV